MSLRPLLIRLSPVWAVLLAILLGMGLVWQAGANPVKAYGELLRGAFGDVFGIATTLVKTTPLLFAGLGVAIALRAGLFNIGAEGQIYLGGLAAAMVGLFLHGLTPLQHIPLAMLAAFVAGALWGFIPIALKVVRGVNEVITTLLMNYVAIFLVSAIVGGPLMEPGAPYPYTRPLDSATHLPVLIPQTDAHGGIIVALVLAFALNFVFARTAYGFRLRAVGASPSAAAYAGINVRGSLVLAMMVGGGLAGLGGAAEVMGLQHRLFEGFSPGYGYDAIVVAFLSNGQPLGVVLMAFFFGALRSGANIMQRSVGIPVAIVFTIQGLAVLFLAASLAWSRRAPRGHPVPAAVEPAVIATPPAEVADHELH